MPKRSVPSLSFDYFKNIQAQELNIAPNRSVAKEYTTALVYNLSYQLNQLAIFIQHSQHFSDTQMLHFEQEMQHLGKAVRRNREEEDGSSTTLNDSMLNDRNHVEIGYGDYRNRKLKAQIMNMKQQEVLSQRERELCGFTFTLDDKITDANLSDAVTLFGFNQRDLYRFLFRYIRNAFPLHSFQKLAIQQEKALCKATLIKVEEEISNQQTKIVTGIMEMEDGSQYRAHRVLVGFLPTKLLSASNINFNGHFLGKLLAFLANAPITVFGTTREINDNQPMSIFAWIHIHSNNQENIEDIFKSVHVDVDKELLTISGSLEPAVCSVKFETSQARESKPYHSKFTAFQYDPPTKNDKQPWIEFGQLCFNLCVTILNLNNPAKAISQFIETLHHINDQNLYLSKAKQLMSDLHSQIMSEPTRQNVSSSDTSTPTIPQIFSPVQQGSKNRSPFTPLNGNSFFSNNQKLPVQNLHLQVKEQVGGLGG